MCSLTGSDVWQWKECSTHGVSRTFEQTIRFRWCASLLEVRTLFYASRIDSLRKISLHMDSAVINFCKRQDLSILLHSCGYREDVCTESRLTALMHLWIRPSFLHCNVPYSSPLTGFIASAEVLHYMQDFFSAFRGVNIGWNSSKQCARRRLWTNPKSKEWLLKDAVQARKCVEDSWNFQHKLQSTKKLW